VVLLELLLHAAASSATAAAEQIRDLRTMHPPFEPWSRPHRRLATSLLLRASLGRA